MSNRNYKPTLAQKKILNHMIDGFSLFSPPTNFTSWSWLMNPLDARCTNVRSSIFLAMRKNKLVIPSDNNGQYSEDEWIINESVVDIEKLKCEKRETAERIRRDLS